MPSLLELQLQLRGAVLGGATPGLVGEIESDGLSAEARLRIYRNHLVATLTAALESTFPVVRRLVDKHFFAYAAHEYLRQHPPQSRCLAEYGAGLADFLSGFEPCKDLPYLAHVARFEWALNAAATAREEAPLKIEALAATPPEGASLFKISLQPSVSYFASSWPIDAIWLANQQKEVRTVDLASGGTTVEMRRADQGFSWQRLAPGTFAFRKALAEGFALGMAAATAASDPAFDLAAALDRLFAERLVVGLGAC
jgi:Putative DNA-binding domain